MFNLSIFMQLYVSVHMYIYKFLERCELVSGFCDWSLHQFSYCLER